MPKEVLRGLLIAGLGAIGVSALYAIVIVLSGSFGLFELKVIFTTLVIGFYCMTTVASFGSGPMPVVHVAFGWLACALAIVGCIITLPVIWAERYDVSTGTWKAMFSIALIAFSLAHVSINYRLSNTSVVSQGFALAASMAAVAVTTLLLHMILNEPRELSEGFWQTMITFAILDVALTIANPICSKLTRSASAA